MTGTSSVKGSFWISMSTHTPGRSASQYPRYVFRYTAILPPSATIIVPVMKAPAGEASSSAAPAMSCG
jgi:hypothetical protein